jgi:DegV family protein with EDD domain
VFDDTNTPVIGIVTDSSSQITPAIFERFAVEVVPMTVTIAGVDYAEGRDLDADRFYAHFRDGAKPEITTSQPSPGQLVAAYEHLIARGCTEIVSIHISESMSGTVASAAIAASSVDVPVHVIDTGSASFGVAVCVWAAGVAIGRGGLPDDIRRRIDNLVPRIGTAFMVGVPLLSERGGRARSVELDGDGVPVLAMSNGELEILDRVTTVEDTIDVMSTYAAGWSARVPTAGSSAGSSRAQSGGGITVAIGTSDASSRPLADRLEHALSGLATIEEIVHYRIGPSVGAHTGPGTFGLFVFPTIR